MKKENKTQTVKQAVEAVDNKKAKFAKLSQTRFKGGGATKALELLDSQAYTGKSSQVIAIINCMVEIANANSTTNVIEAETLLEAMKASEDFQTTQTEAKVLNYYRPALVDLGVVKVV
tara:strand:- start:163 stop:516 length:354 start_codon:yes stop_codon:yes gene_type:complete